MMYALYQLGLLVVAVVLLLSLPFIVFLTAKLWTFGSLMGKRKFEQLFNPRSTSNEEDETTA